ncbi:hypothetical protein V8C40DRAFT_237322 [Trichoderma camerunense]
MDGYLCILTSWGPARGSGVWSGMSSNPNGSPISADVNGRAKCEMRMKLCWMQSSLPNPIAPIRASGPAVKGASKQDWRTKCKGKGSSPASPASPAPCGPTLPLGYNACMISALARPAHRRVFWSDCDGGPWSGPVPEGLRLFASEPVRRRGWVRSQAICHTRLKREPGMEGIKSDQIKSMAFERLNLDERK